MPKRSTINPLAAQRLFQSQPTVAPLTILDVARAHPDLCEYLFTIHYQPVSAFADSDPTVLSIDLFEQFCTFLLPKHPVESWLKLYMIALHHLLVTLLQIETEKSVWRLLERDGDLRAFIHSHPQERFPAQPSLFEDILRYGADE